MVVPSHYWTGPIAALLALGVILLICRWVFAPPARTPSRPAPSRGDYGLLVPVATTRTVEDADLLRDVLTGAGIRCTVTRDEPARSWQVLVFRSDAGPAGELVRT